MQSKKWWQSRTVWSAAISAAASVAVATGVIGEGERAVLEQGAAQGVAILAALAAVVYRVKAEKTIGK
jgi:hypothetical protein